MVSKQEKSNKKILTLKERIKELERKNDENKKKLEMLQREKETAQRYMDLAGTVLLALDDRGNIKLINKYGLKVLGYKRENLIGKNWFRLCLPKKDRSRVKKVFQQLVLGNIKTVEYYENQVLTKAGEERIMAWHNTALKDPEGNICGTLTAGVDITENKKVQELLVKEKLLNKEYLDSLPGLFYVFDEKKFIQWNRQWESVSGYSSDELSEMYGTDFFDGVDKKLIAKEMKKVFIEGSGEIEAELITKKKKRIPYYFTGSRRNINGKSHLVGLGIDITKLRKAEKEVQKLAEIVKHSSELVNLATLDGQMIFLNDAGKRMLGIDNKKVMSTNMLDVIPDKYINTVKNIIIPNLMSGETWEGDLQYRNLRSGILTDVHTMAFTIEDPVSKKPLYLANISYDITESKRAKKKLEKAYEDLKKTHKMFIHAEKFAALGRFSSSVAHEVKNPLGIILGGTEYLENTIQDKDKKDIKKAFNVIKHAVRRGNNVVHNLLAYSRPPEARFEKIKCSELIESEIEFIKYGFIKKKIKIDVDVEEDLYIKGDKGQLQQALFNIMINALDSMGNEGRLTIKAYKKDLPELSGSYQFCIIEISDIGTGISKRNLDKIFEPFFTSKKGQRKGTGLGLSAVKTIIDNHNGKITVKSKLKKGTCVKIMLKAV